MRFAAQMSSFSYMVSLAAASVTIYPIENNSTMTSEQLDHDVERLHNAMEGRGTDEATLVNILGTKTSGDRERIAKRYYELYDNTLKNALKWEVRFTFGAVLRLLVVPLVDAEVMILHEAFGEFDLGDGTEVGTGIAAAGVGGGAAAAAGFSASTLAGAGVGSTAAAGLLAMPAVVGAAAVASGVGAFSLAKWAGTKERHLIEILLGRTNSELVILQNRYEELSKYSLVKKISSETSRSFKELLLNCIDGEQVNFDAHVHTSERATQDAREFYAATLGHKRFGIKMGEDKNVITRVLCNLPPKHLIAVNTAFLNEFGMTMAKVIDKKNIETL